MAYRVQGRVVVAESGSGIADLVVCIFDPGSSLSTLPTHANTTAFAGNERLGSILTDAEGRFSLDFDEARFAPAGGKASRPDLMLCILGPDRPASAKQANGLDYEHRLLFRTSTAIANAADIESFVIQIDQAQLERAGIRLPQTSAAGLGADTLRLRLEQQTSQRKAIAQVQRKYVGLALPVLAQERTTVNGLMERLANDGVFPRLGFIGLSPALAAVRDALHLRWRRTLEQHRETRVAMRFRLGDADLRALGGDPAAIAAGATFPVTFCDLAHRLGSDGTLLRNRDLLTALQARRAVRALSTTTPVPQTDTPPAGGDADATATLVRNEILQRLRAQVAQLPDIDSARGTTPADDLLRIKDIVRKLEMSGGPANVVATRDLNVLQIAFESVWTSFFDHNFERSARELYRNLVRLETDYGISGTGIEGVSSAQELRSLLDDILGSAAYAGIESVPSEVAGTLPWLTASQWNGLDETGKSMLMQLAERIQARAPQISVRRADGQSWTTVTTGGQAAPSSPEADRSDAEAILAAHSRSPIATAEALVSDLEASLAETYHFSVFAPGTVNYGALLTYRQQWSPVSYQVGRLVETMPLAPGESREFTIKRSSKRTEHERRTSKQSQESSRETQSTTRTEQEALNASTMAINNRLSSEAELNIGIGTIGASSEFSQNFTQESRRMQKTFAEIARKAAEQVKSESEVTIESETETYTESNAKHTLSNPNNEITVTYLLYELERRYQVASRLHRVQPVILVAMDMPMPHDIDEGWLLEHAWMLRDSLLDAELRPALRYLEDGRTGDDLELELLRTNFLAQQRLTQALEMEYNGLAEQARNRRAQIVRFLQGEGEARASEVSDGDRIAAAIFSGGLTELFGGGQSDTDERLESRRKAAEKALEYLDAEIESKGAALARAQSALDEASKRFAAAIKQKAQRDTAILQLRLHVKNNIFHYMQQQWMREHPDARYFSLYDREVPFFPPNPDDYRLRAARPEELDEEVPGLMREGAAYVLEFVPPAPPASLDALPQRKLGDIADLDRLLGFRGNFAIFPLRACCQLTDVMLHPFADEYFGVRDPAFELPYTGAELLAYAQAAWNDPDAALDEAGRTRLASMVVDAMLRWPDAEQEIVLPTGQLFMEALKGDGSLLEPFKLAHRGLDVLKVEEEVRAKRIDALRRAARIAGDVLDIDPTSVDKFVLVQGQPGGVIET
ncbi:hypothetical protein [Solilutibacter silvestris]|uniref:hypothetical protein n=1 Tax=Solilutibacter silvestris TaxID=1645665 RepID=UPI003D349F0B